MVAVAGAALAQQAAGPFTAAQVTAGRAEYAENCASCHQADMSGGTDALPLIEKKGTPASPATAQTTATSCPRSRPSP